MITQFDQNRSIALSVTSTNITKVFYCNKNTCPMQTNGCLFKGRLIPGPLIQQIRVQLIKQKSHIALTAYFCQFQYFYYQSYEYSLYRAISFIQAQSQTQSQSLEVQRFWICYLFSLKYKTLCNYFKLYLSLLCQRCLVFVLCFFFE